jgi:hypothetical protein
MVFLLLCAGATMLFAATGAEKLYTKAKALDLSTASIDSIIQSYDKLNDRVAEEIADARKDLYEAATKGDVDRYYDARSRLASLGACRLGEQETKTLLSRIVAEDEPERGEHAAWLYENSSWYRPTLTLDFSSSGEGYRYSFRRQTSKAPGSQIVLPSSSDLRFDSKKVGILSGWGLTKDKATYQEGETIEMPYTDQTLYAIWTGGVRFSDPVTETDTLLTDVAEGDEVTAPSLTSPDSSYLFAGWYDRSDGTLLQQGETYALEGKAASFEARWRELSVDDVQPVYWSNDRIPTQTQVSVGFEIKNGGTVPLEGLVATLSSESDDVTVVDDQATVGTVPPQCYKNNSNRYVTDKPAGIDDDRNAFRIVVSDGVQSGTVIPFDLEFTDSKGNSWSTSFSFTVQ